LSAEIVNVEKADRNVVVARMVFSTFLALQLATGVLSAHLRSSQLPWVDDARSEDFSLMVAEAGPPTAVSKSVADELTDEHLYFAKECKDCVYKGDQCGCQPTVEYFACVTKHCHPAKDPAFADKCSARKNACGSELDIECLGEKTFCKSKFHQLAIGGLGLTVDVNENDAFCGPFGKCLGHLGMSAKIIRRAKEASAPKVSLPKVVNFVAGPAPAVAGAPAPGPAPASAPTFAVTPPAPKAPPAPPIWFECGLPKVDKPDINKKEDWTTSQAEAKDDKAQLKLSLPKTWIKAAEGRKVYCLLKDGKDGKRLTQPAWSAVTNVHAKVEKKEEKKVEKPAKQEVKVFGDAKIEQGSVFGKPPWMADKAQAKLAEKKVVKVEKKAEKKEEKVEKKAEKKVEKAVKKEENKEEKVEKKAEKKVEKAVKKEEKVEKKEEKAAVKEAKKAEFGQPPWMADKEAKEAKEAEHAKMKSAIVEAKAVEENKKREDAKKANKDAANDKAKAENNSGLPWMQGK